MKSVSLDIDECTEPEEMIAYMLIEGVLFTNNGHWDQKWPKDKTTLHVNCNDVFAWGCADAEDISYSEIPELFNMFKKDEYYGPTMWCIKKRKQMPQKPLADRMIAAGYNLEDLIK